jgi:tetratricopeptide (TPR) repeat protein
LGEAARLAEQSLRLYEELGDQWWTARVLALKAMTLHAVDFSEAKMLIEQSLELGRVLGDRAGEIANAISGLAEFSISQGLFREAEDAARELIRLKRETGEQYVIMVGLMNLGRALFWGGEYAAAEPRFHEMLSIADDQGVAWYQAYARALMIDTKAHQGKYRERLSCC